MKEIEEKLKTVNKPKAKKYIDTGCSLINLALSDYVDRGIQQGSILNLIGESHAGKSLIAGTVLAQMAHNKKLDDYKLVYDDAEEGFLFDIAEFFGKKTEKRVEVKTNTSEDNPPSTTVEDLEIALRKLEKEETPFAYVMDSMDALSTKTANEKVDEVLTAYEKGKTTTGTYGADKAKYLATFFARVNPNIVKTSSLLFIISHSKDKMTGMGGKTRSGGATMKYLSGLELWISPVFGAKSKIKKAYKGKEDIIGSRVKFKIGKSRNSGKPKEVVFRMLNGYGIDNIGTSLEWLIDYGYGERIKEITDKKLIETMVKEIEDKNLEKQLDSLLQECWDEREANLSLDRKSRYE